MEAEYGREARALRAWTWTRMGISPFQSVSLCYEIDGERTSFLSRLTERKGFGKSLIPRLRVPPSWPPLAFWVAI